MGAERNPGLWVALGSFDARPRALAMRFPLIGGLRLIDLVENASLVEVLRLRLGPTAKQRIICEGGACRKGRDKGRNAYGRVKSCGRAPSY
jgi:hypothetical protein